MYPRAKREGICVVIWNYGEKCTTFADANPSEGMHSERDERGKGDEEGVRAFANKNLRRSLVVRKKAVPLQPQNERRVAGSDYSHDDV